MKALIIFTVLVMVACGDAHADQTICTPMGQSVVCHTVPSGPLTAPAPPPRTVICTPGPNGTVFCH